ncbi:hypothetical protein AMECASPLE_035317 [Ameca splendens]|uniref:Uncharacterized protein n=1 Tax=Ameca splendens TaxID=208324 RepID=A0ABV0XKG4_9TELE
MLSNDSIENYSHITGFLEWCEFTNVLYMTTLSMRDTRTNNADELKAAIKATWDSRTPQQNHRLNNWGSRSLKADTEKNNLGHLSTIDLSEFADINFCTALVRS